MPVVIHDLVVTEVPAPPAPTAPQPDTGVEATLAELHRRLEVSPHRAARARAH